MIIDKNTPFSFSRYWFIAIILILFAWYCSAFPFGIFKVLRSEYKPAEQLSKLLILFSFAVSVYGYKFSRTVRTKKLSIAFLMLSTAMYFGESNFIHTAIQPIIGLALAVVIVRGLWNRNNSALCSFAAFGMFIFFGIVADVIDDLLRLGYWHSITNLEPGFLIFGFAKLEEVFELTGGFLLLQTTFLIFLSEIEQPERDNRVGLVIIVFSFFLITTGNSILHFQYSPPLLLQGIGCVLSYMGLFSIMLANLYFLNHKYAFYLKSKFFFYAALFSCLIVLPTVHGNIPASISTVLWLPVFLVVFINLFISKGGAHNPYSTSDNRMRSGLDHQVKNK